MSDILTIGSKEINNTKQLEKKLIEEKAKKAAQEILKKKFKTQLSQVVDEINKGKTLEQVIDDVNNKHSNLTRSARDFVISFKEDVLKEWINDYK